MTHDQLLEARLDDLARSADLPDVPVADDLARARRGLARRRAAVGAVALTTAAVVTVGAIGVTGGSEDAGPGPAGGPAPSTAKDSTTPSPKPAPPPDRRTGKQLLTDWAEALAVHLDPDGGHLETKVTGYQSGVGLGTKLGWSVAGEDGLGMVQIYVGRDAFQGSFWQDDCTYGPACEEVTVRGVTMRVQRVDGATAVYHQQRDGDRVFLLLDPLFGNNSLVPLENLDFPLRTLAAAVSDPVLTTPTRRQVAGTSESFGWSDPRDPGVPGVSPAPR